jgi:hypothetical protein
MAGEPTKREIGKGKGMERMFIGNWVDSWPCKSPTSVGVDGRIVILMKGRRVTVL